MHSYVNPSVDNQLVLLWAKLLQLRASSNSVDLGDNAASHLGQHYLLHHYSMYDKEIGPHCLSLFIH